MSQNNISLEEALQLLDRALRRNADLEKRILTMRETINKKARVYRPEDFIGNHSTELREIQAQHYTNLGTIIRLILFPNAIRASSTSHKEGYKGVAAITVTQLSDRQYEVYMKTYEKVLSLIVGEASKVKELGFDGFDVL